MKKSCNLVAILGAAAALMVTRGNTVSYAADQAANMIILDEIAVQNLGIEAETVEPRTFESTVFAIGRLEETSSSRSVLSSRIAGRAVQVHAFVGDHVEEGMTLVEVESRQPGNPPPVVPLKAAQSGLVIESHIRLGQPVEPDLELLDIADRRRMWAVAKIPEGEASKIEPGTLARIRIPALGEEVFESRLLRYGIAADREGASLDGIFELDNPDGELKPGMRVEFFIVTSSRENVLAVPREAVQGDPSKRLVFIKDFDVPNVFLRSPVRLGEQNDGYFEVLSGVFPGDHVVRQGAYSLAFAGGGTLSLKEALDAAHGHEHNEDGSEITEEQRERRKADEGITAEMDSSSVRPYQIYSAVVTLLCLALVPVRARNRQAKG